MGLFDQVERENLAGVKPLASRMRPTRLEDFVGQEHLLGPGKLLRRLIETDRFASIVFFGPPGTGKTTLAEVIARTTRRTFHALNAAAIGVKELRETLDRARREVEAGGGKTVLFVDELHHFNKQQQNVLLPDVEEGIVSLIAATTQNPFFALIAPLLSRSQIFELKPLGAEDVKAILLRAISDKSAGLGSHRITIEDEALEFLAKISDGDARRAVGALEIAAFSLPEGRTRITLQDAEESIQRKVIRYDRLGDDHYDAASALIKSIRGSDPDAGLYWMVRMIEAGEDPRFIARRLVILASEDVGNADPQALPLAMAAAQAVEFIGLPECRIPLAQVVAYLALAPKSNASYAALSAATEDVRENRLVEVPQPLRDKHYQGAKRLGRGEDYIYPHDAPEGWVPQDYLGIERRYYHPVPRGYEAELREKLANLRKLRVSDADPGENEGKAGENGKSAHESA